MLPRPEDRENLLVKCSAELETKREQLGSQGYGELARCAMQAQDIEQLVRCEGASDEAEEPRRSGKLK